MPPAKGPQHMKRRISGKHRAVEPAKKKYKKPSSVKNQLRSMERMLKRELPPKTKEKGLQRLQQLQHQLQSNKDTELERLYATRYHKVRFFERVKLERRIKQLQRDPADLSAIEAQEKLQQLRADLQYVLDFPKGHKYVSILKKADTLEAQELLDKQREQLRQLARQQAADRAALAESDEGRSLGMLTSTLEQADSKSQAAHPADTADEDDFLVPEDQPEVPMSPGPTASVPERMDGRWSAPAEPSQRPVTIKSAVRKPAAAEPATAKRKAQTLHQPELQGRKPKREAHKRSSSHIAAVHQAGPAAPHVQQQKSVALGRHTTAKAGTQPPAHRLAGSQSSRPAPQAAKPTAKPVLSASKPLSIVPEKAPARTRAEGGRKRRKKV